jgi:putative addiction module antidote
MNMKLKITTIGNSAGVVLPKELLARLRVEKGDELFVTETPDGIKLMAYDPVFEKQMAVAERIMRENRDVLRKLADS